MSAQSTAQLEPTLNDLVGLPEKIYFPFSSSVPQDSRAPWQHDHVFLASLRTPVRRIIMGDMQTDDRRLENGASIWLPLNRVIPSETTRPMKFCNEGTRLWGYYETNFTLKHLSTSSTSNALMGVIVLKDQEPCVDPWEVASNQEPPFYRKVFMELWVARQTHEGTSFRGRSLRERFRQRLVVCPSTGQFSSIRLQPP